MTALAALDAASSGAGSYLHWGVISISTTNLIIILAMVVLFVLAVLLPFPGAGEPSEAPRVPEQRQEDRP
jgi:hypothetical protein